MIAGQTYDLDDGEAMILIHTHKAKAADPQPVESGPLKVKGSAGHTVKKAPAKKSTPKKGKK